MTHKLNFSGIVLFETDHCLIPVYSRGTVYWAKVDDDVAVWASQKRWHLTDGTATTLGYPIAGRVRLHRLVAQTPSGMDTDHINHDSLDNRRCNLRACTSRENHQNMRPRRDGSSGWKGTSWRSRASRWRAVINRDGRQVYLGHFDNEADAALAYNFAAIKYFGAFAYLNDHPDNAIAGLFNTSAKSAGGAA